MLSTYMNITSVIICLLIFMKWQQFAKMKGEWDIKNFLKPFSFWMVIIGVWAFLFNIELEFIILATVMGIFVGQGICPPKFRTR